jgi:hypothetical protein
MLNLLALSLLFGTPSTANLDATVGKEMSLAIVTVNKALGLESWKGPEVCVDWGGMEAMIKTVNAEDTRKCATAAVAKDFPGLGTHYVMGILMADIGPATVFTLGIGEAEGWGAYSCDYTRKCRPTKLTAPSKPTKRLVDRIRRACANDKTVWLPHRGNVCDRM